MQSYYAVLGLSPDAGMPEIKRAYREKAKKLHPDLSGETAEQFRLLNAAYKAVCDIKYKLLFDKTFSPWEKAFREKKEYPSFNYREWLLQRNDEESRCKLIFWDLLHSREEEAVHLFKTLKSEMSSFRLSAWFSREDFMDYGFILAEELIFRSEFYDAALLLEQIVLMEQKRPYFKHFFPEVIFLARNILLHHIDGTINTEVAIELWERALDWGFSKKDEAALLIKIATSYTKTQNTAAAAVCLKEAKRLNALLRIPPSLKYLA